MGQGPSLQFRSDHSIGPEETRASSKLRQRLQVLEALVQGTSKHKKKELLRELATSSGSQPAVYGILPKAPEEFKLGALIAAGSYGRVYAGTYRGQPAALKLLILDEESAAAILNEVRLCLKLNHRNLVRLLDCAVVSTSSRQFSLNSSLDETPTGWYSNGQQGYSYHPMLTEKQHEPCTPCSPAASISSDQQQGLRELARATDNNSHTTGIELLHLDGRGLGLTTASGHACFEVWIAMELCDGGTLAEQVGRGFQYCPNSHHADLELLLTVALDIARALSYMHAEHVCHGDLKAENVLLKILHDIRPGSEAGSTSDCSWLQLLCHSSSNSSILTRSRRCSNDSCWSFCRSSSGKGIAHTSSSSGSRSPPSEGRDGSSAHHSRHRSSGHLLSLSGLCCIASADSGLSEDVDIKGDQGVDEDSMSPGSLACIVNPVAADNVRMSQQNTDSSESTVMSCSLGDAATTEQQEQAPDSAAAAAVSNCISAAAEMELDTPAAPTALLGPDNSIESCDGTPSADLSSLQQLPVRRTSSSSQHAAEEAAEEEHVAPLSLYTATREHRRSRRLSRTGALSNVQAALAAAAAAGRLDPSLAPSRLLGSGRTSASASGSRTSGDGNAQSCSDDDGEAPSKNSPVRVLQSGQQQQQAQQSTLFSCAASDTGEIASDQYSSSSSNGQPLAARRDASSRRIRERRTGEVPERLGTAQAAYGQRRHGRSRRHSYCYGTTSANYDAMCLSVASNAAAVAPFLRQQHNCSHAGVPGVSAAEAAAAIAAAAEAAREEIQEARRVELAGEQTPNGRRFRSRRMSCDDQLLQHLGNACVVEAHLYQPGRSDIHLPVSGLGRLPLALRRASSHGAEHDDLVAVSGKSRGRMRRHSWTAAYLGDAMDAASAALRGHGLAGHLFPYEQQDDIAQADHTDRMSTQLKVNASSSKSFAGAGQRLNLSQANSHNDGRRRRARRHSWAGFLTERQTLAAAAAASGSAGKYGKGPRRLSSCFAPAEAVIEGEDVGSPHRVALHLQPCISCCSDSSYLPLDNADAEPQQSLLSGSHSSSAELPDTGTALSNEAVIVGCLGRLTAKSISSRSHLKRRSSWCCGGTHEDISLGAWSAHSSWSSSAELLPSGSFMPSVTQGPGSCSLADHPANQGGRGTGLLGRRSSRDGADIHHPLFSAHAAVAVRTASTTVGLGERQPCSINDSPHPEQRQEQVGAQAAGSLPGAVAATTALGSPAGLQQELQNSCTASAAADHESAATDQLHPGQSVNHNLQQGGAHTASLHTACLPAAVASGTSIAAARRIRRGSCNGTAEADTLDDDTAHAEVQVLFQSGTDKCGSVMHAATGVAADTSSSCGQHQQQSHHSRCLATAQQLLQQTASPTATSAAGHAEHQHAALNSGQQLALEPPLELFTGSFDFKPTGSSRRSSMLSCATSELFQDQSIQSPLTSPDAIHSHSNLPVLSHSGDLSPQAICPSAMSPSQPGESTAASRTAASGANKERRWSTGVAAHDLLLRQQALPRHLSATEGAKVRRASACIPGAFDDIFDAPCAAAARTAEPSRGQEDTPASGSLLSRPQRVDVLGMPRKPAVLGQRRMSYDTATGAYHMVSNRPLASAAAARLLRGSDQHLDLQPTQQQAAMEIEQEQHAVQSKDDQHLQRDAQQHMQRLIEALAKKGYGGLVIDNVNQSSGPQQLLPHQQPGALRSPATPNSNVSPFASAAATADATSAQASGKARRPSYCVPPAYSRPKYCAKVCDFGFSQCLRAGQSHCSTDAAGTITHQAPEVIKCGYLSPAADIYAFGIIMWELLTGDRPFRGLLEGDVVYGVCETGLRPQFPPGAPEMYVTLAQQCWAENTADRPTARQLLKRLNEMLYEVRRQRQLNAGSSASGNGSKAAPNSRPRRHSMPVVGAGRKRRASRRLSLFLPLARQPAAVPEHKPLEQPAPWDSSRALSSSTSGASGAVTMTGAPAQAPAGSASCACRSTAGGAAGMAAGSAALSAGSRSSWSVESSDVKVVRQPAAVVEPPAGSDEQVLTTAEESSSEWFQSFD